MTTQISLSIRKKGLFFWTKVFCLKCNKMLDTGYWLLVNRCILSAFFQLNYAENNNHYLNS